MKLCVFGCGAVGGLLAARLSRSGVVTSVIARGETLRRVAEHGLTITDREGTWSEAVQTAGDPAELGPQDVLLLTLKANLLPRVAEQIKPLMGPHTAVVTAVNGIPWWYLRGEGAFSGHRLEAVDPGGCLSGAIPASQSVGCVIHLGASVREPAHIVHHYGNTLMVGGSGEGSDRAASTVSALLTQAGFKVTDTPSIRHEVWKKLLSNIAINPVSLVTRQGCDVISANPHLNALMHRMMAEAVTVAREFQVPLDVDLDRQVAGFAAIGDFKTSMLQDYLAGKPVELEPILGAVIEMADLASVPVPSLKAVYALAHAEARTGEDLQSSEAGTSATTDKVKEPV